MNSTREKQNFICIVANPLDSDAELDIQVSTDILLECEFSNSRETYNSYKVLSLMALQTLRKFITSHQRLTAITSHLRRLNT